MSDGGWSVLVRAGVVLPIDPGPASAFLRRAAPGAYTTTRTASEATGVLLWDRHLARLNESLRLLAIASPHLYPSVDGLDIKRLVQPSVGLGLAQALQLRRTKEEIAFTVLVCRRRGDECDLARSVCDVYVHASNYSARHEGRMPLAISVAVMGPGRTLARAKCSLWASTRQSLEKARPAGTSEIILSNDGDSLLEGTLTNFFVVASRDQLVLTEGKDSMSLIGQGHLSICWNDIEVQTAPLEDAVLPGIIRSLVIEVCREAGVPVHEVAPSWACRRTWREAFVTSSIRILQPVVEIQMPTAWPLDFSPASLQEEPWQRLELEALAKISTGAAVYQLREEAC